MTTPMKNLLARLLLTCCLLGTVMTPAMVTHAQSFENATGLRNISDQSVSGVETQKLGIYGPSTTGDTNLVVIITNIINSVFLLLGFAAVALLIFEGVLLILSRGDEKQQENVKKTIINIAIGFGVILLSYAIVNQILAVLGANNIDDRAAGLETIGELQRQVGIDQTNVTNPIMAAGAYAPAQLAVTKIMPPDLYKKFTATYIQSADVSKAISADYRSVDYEFVAGSARLPALRGSLLRVTKAEWDQVRNGSFGLFIPGNDTLSGAKAWVKPRYTFSAPVDARSVTASTGNSSTGTAGRFIDLKPLIDRMTEGVETPNVLHVQIPGQTTAALTVVVLKPGEEDRYVFGGGEVFADYSSLSPLGASAWTDIEAGGIRGYDRRRSYFAVKNKGVNLEARTYTTGASIQLNNGAGDQDIEAELQIRDQNTLPENFQTIEHTLVRGDGTLIKDAAKNGDTITVTIPLGKSVYIVDDITAILKDGRRVNLGSNTLVLGNNSDPRLVAQSGLGQLVVEGRYAGVTGTKDVRMMPGDSLALTKAVDKPVSLTTNIKYFARQTPTLVEVVSPGIKDGIVRFVDGQIQQTGTPINGVTPFTVSPELVFEKTGTFPVSIAVRDYTLGQTLAVMQFTASVFTDGTDLAVAPNHAGVVGNAYRIRTFPGFAETPDLESKRVEIKRSTASGSGGQTVLNRTLTGGLDDFEYVFDQDGEYVFTIYNKFKGRSDESTLSKSLVVLPQAPLVDFTLAEKAGNPTVFEVTDASKYLEGGTVYVDVSPYDAAQTQSEWQTVGSKRVKQLTFAKPGTYRVTVTGRNKYGETSTKSTDVTVSTDITYDISLLDNQDNVFPQNQTPRYPQGQPIKTRISGKNISKIEVGYGSTPAITTMTTGTQGTDGRTTFAGSLTLPEQGQYTLTYTFYSVSKPTEKAMVVSRSVLVRRPLEPLADFSVSEGGAVISPTAGACVVSGTAREGYVVAKNREYSFDGSASLSSTDLPVNRDAATTGFRWNIGTREVSAKTVAVRERFTLHSQDSSACTPVTFTILENINGVAKTSQMTKYFKVANSLPTYDSFVVEWPNGALTTPVSVRAKLRGLRDPDETNQNIQVLWFYEVQGNQLFNEVSYDAERVVRLENYGAAGSVHTYRIGAQIYDMNTKESIKVYSDPRSITTGTNPSLQTSLVEPSSLAGLGYAPWVKGTNPFRVQIAAKMSDGAAVSAPTVRWSMQRYGTFEGCASVPDPSPLPIAEVGLSSAVRFPLCGLYRINAVVSSGGQLSEQSVALRVYDADVGLTAQEKPVFAALSGLRGATSGVIAVYEPPKENTVSPFFPTSTGTRLAPLVQATYVQGLSPSVAKQATGNGSYATSSGVTLTASYTSVADMLASYNLPANVINDRLAAQNPDIAAQVRDLRASGRSDGEIQNLLARNLAGSNVMYDAREPYTVPFGVAYDIYAEFGLRPAATLNKVAKDDPALGKKIADLRTKGLQDEGIVQVLRNEQGTTVSTNLHAAADASPQDVVAHLVTQGLSRKEIVEKILLDNPALEGSRSDLLAASSNAALLDILQSQTNAQEAIAFQPLAPLRVSIGRAYLLLKERAYTDDLIVDKLRADDPDVAVIVRDAQGQGLGASEIIRRLLAEPGREVSLRVSSSVVANFSAIYATLRRHGLAEETIYEKLRTEDETFRVVYEAARKKTSDISAYYHMFVEEPTLRAMTYKPESMFVLPLRLAYGEYIAMGLTPEQVFTRLAKDNPNFGQDYETLKREKSGGEEIFTSLVKNGAERKVRFSYMRPLEMPADQLAHFFVTQGIPEELAVQKVVADNPVLSAWYAKQREAQKVPVFADLIADYPRNNFLVAQFTGWDTTLDTYLRAMSRSVSSAFALDFLETQDPELGRLVVALRSQKKSSGEIAGALLGANAARSLRLYPYMGTTVPLKSATRELSALYSSEEAVIGHFARFDATFGAYFTQASARLYSPAQILGSVGEQRVYTPAFRPVVGETLALLRSILASGLPLEKALTLYGNFFPELQDLTQQHTGDPAALFAHVRRLYPQGVRLPLLYLVDSGAVREARSQFGLSSSNMSLGSYMEWLRGWGISADIALQSLAALDPEVASILESQKDASIDAKVAAVTAKVTEVLPNPIKKYPVPFTQAFRMYERRGLSPQLIYTFLAGQDPVFQSVLAQLRGQRVPTSALFDALKDHPDTQTVVTNPLLPADVPTLQLVKSLENSALPTDIIVQKIRTDLPVLAREQQENLQAVMTSVARDSLLQTLPLSLTRPVQLSQDQRKALLTAYAVEGETAAQLAAMTGSGMTLPPQVLVDIPTYVDIALGQGVEPRSLVEDVMRLVPSQVTALRPLLDGASDVATLKTGLSSALSGVSTLPLLTRAPLHTADEQLVTFAVQTAQGVLDATGYLPGTVPQESADMATSAGIQVPGFSHIAPYVFLPAGISAYVLNPAILTLTDPFGLQNTESYAQFALVSSEERERLTNLLSASGALLRSSAPQEKKEPINVFGLVGETTLLDCGAYSLALTMEGQKTLVCTAGTAYERGLDLYRTTLLRMLGEEIPEEMATLMAAFDRAITMEDRLEAMQRLRDRTSRLALSRAMIDDLLARLSLVRVFDLDATATKTLAKRGADDLRGALERILDAAGRSMQTDRAGYAEAFASLVSAQELTTVLVVRYTLAMTDVLRSQTIDPMVKDAVIRTMDTSLRTMLADKDLAQLATSNTTVAAHMTALTELLKEENFTAERVQAKLTYLRALAVATLELPQGALVTQAVRSMGQASAQALAQEIENVALLRSSISQKVLDLVLSSSLWERQRAGLVAMLESITKDTRYSAEEKQQILAQLVDARLAHLTKVREILAGSDIDPAQKSLILTRLDTVLGRKVLATILEEEQGIWGALTRDVPIELSARFPSLLEETANLNLSLLRAVTNSIAPADQARVAAYFAPLDPSLERQMELAEALEESMGLLSEQDITPLRTQFVTQAAPSGSSLASFVANYLASTDRENVRFSALQRAIRGQTAATETELRAFSTATEVYVRSIVTKSRSKERSVGRDLLADVRQAVLQDTAAIVTSDLDLASSAHLVHDLKKTILGHPTLPLQYKMEMLFETQHAFPFAPFARAFTLCTPLYVKDTTDVVRRLCAEEKNQGRGQLPVEREQLFALMQVAAAQKPEVGTGAVLGMAESALSDLTTKTELSLSERQSVLAQLSRALESPEVSYADRQKLLAYLYRLPVIGDELLTVSETTLTLDAFYLSAGELESRLRAIMLGVGALPTSLQGTVRESLMQVKKYYNSDTQRRHVMVSLAANVIRGSDLSEARKDTMVRALETVGDTLQPVPVERLSPEVSFERMDDILRQAATAPGVDALLAARADTVQLLGQGDVLGTVGVLARMENLVGSTGLSPQEKSDLGFYLVVARDFLTYVQSQGPRVQDVEVPTEVTDAPVDPLPSVEQPTNPAPQGSPSFFWTMLWGIAYLIVGLILFALTLGGILYVLFIYYKKTHPEVHVDFEEYILLLRGQLSLFMKRFSKAEDRGVDIHRVPDEPLPDKPQEIEETAPVAPVQEELSSEAASLPQEPVPAAQPQAAAPTWLNLGGDSAPVETPSSVNGTPAPEGVQQPTPPVQSNEEAVPPAQST